MSDLIAKTTQSMTPILDRLESMPPVIGETLASKSTTTSPGRATLNRKLPGRQILIWTAIFWALGSSYLNSFPWAWITHQIKAMFPEFFQIEWTPARVFLLGFSLLLIFFATVALHEMGHLVGGLCAGFRFSSIQIGPVHIHRGWRISRYRGPGVWFGGAAYMIPIFSDNLVRRALMLVCAGPAANLLVGCIMLILPIRSFAGSLFALVSLMVGLASLYPAHTLITDSDGARIWMLLRRREKGERWLALLRLTADLAEGISPESLPAEHLSKAIAVLDNSVDTVNAHAIAFMSAMFRRNYGEAGQYLETCLKYSGFVAPVMQESLMSEAVVFQGRVRKSLELAEEWLAELPVNTQLLRLRLPAEAAVLEARGDIEGCVRKLDEYEREVSLIPERMQRELILRELSQWRSEFQTNVREEGGR